MNARPWNTNESATAFDADIQYVSPLLENTSGRWAGYQYTCPRCGWQSVVLKWRVGARAAAVRHQPTCPLHRLDGCT